MKNLKSFLLAAFTLTTLTNVESAFAKESACKNQKTVVLDGYVTMTFCEIPAADGVMIGNNDDFEAAPAKPRNFQKFQIGQFTVTQLQYKTIMQSEPWMANGSPLMYVQEGDSNPAVWISYEQAKQFTRTLNLIDPTATYRLPTEAEFEYAARGGTKTTYYWGDEMDTNFPFFAGNIGSESYAHAVDSCPVPYLNNRMPGYCANQYGLFHMLGNVWELTEDVFVRGYENAPTNGNEPVKGEPNAVHTTRGGSFLDDTNLISATWRGYAPPNKGYGDIGFRVVRIPKATR